MITSGSVVGNAVTLTATYNVTPGGFDPYTMVDIEGTISADGTMSGTWSDNYASSSRSGTWHSTSGYAVKIVMGPAVGDTNSDGYISTAEGVPFYGGIVNSLTTSGDTSPSSALALERYPVANGNGDYTYSRTFTLSDDITNLEDVHIVVHGADINESGVYDGVKESSIAPGVPFEATVPVACGLVYESGTNEYASRLNQLNSTGVTGDVTMYQNGREVTVNMSVENTSPNLPHAQHFHLGGSNECPTNTIGVMQDNSNGTSTGDIGGEVVGDGVMLEVTSIEMIDTTATANGSFGSGWNYVFHITAPMDEEDLAMKFNDWMRTGGNGIISVANNMRISSAQADNGGATILLTAENMYSTPALRMTGDLNLELDGRQVEIIVEVAVPNGTQNGSYTTSYSVRSL
jgi:hypothetical protein